MTSKAEKSREQRREKKVDGSVMLLRKVGAALEWSLLGLRELIHDLAGNADAVGATGAGR